MAEPKEKLMLWYSDIKKEKRDTIPDGETVELYWDDFTEEFQKRYFDRFGENGNHDVIPLMICVDQFIKDGIEPAFEWEWLPEEEEDGSEQH